MKKIISAAIKAFISILILVYLFYKIDQKEVWHLLLQVNIAYILIALGLYITGQIFCS